MGYLPGPLHCGATAGALTCAHLSCAQSLTGHQSSVESVSFDNDEMVVAAGGSNGSIKVFELQTGKGALASSLQDHM